MMIKLHCLWGCGTAEEVFRRLYEEAKTTTLIWAMLSLNIMHSLCFCCIYGFEGSFPALIVVDC